MPVFLKGVLKSNKYDSFGTAQVLLSPELFRS